MKAKEPKKNDKDSKDGTDLETIKKLLKKNEIQTNVLKKIISQNKLSNNK